MKTVIHPTPNRVLTGFLAAMLCMGANSQAQQAASPTSGSQAEPTIVLQPFQVSAERDYGYRKTGAITASRTGEDIIKVPQAVEIISSELLSDFSIGEANQVFRYSSSVKFGEAEVAQGAGVILRGFNLPRYVNGVGLANSFSIQPYLPADNLDRVEIAKGPVGLYYANSTPNGIANYITKKPEFKNATSLTLTGGTFDYRKAVLDTQSVISEDKGLAFRLIASYHSRDGRVDGSYRDYKFLAPSFTFRPNSKIEISGEFNYQKAKNPYGSAANVWNFAVNPQYFTDVYNPNAAILSYIRTTFGQADDNAARAFILNRWAPVNGTAVAGAQTWSVDAFNRTGAQPFLLTGSTIAWDKYSLRGDKFAANSDEANQNSEANSAEVSVVLTPIENFTARYHWAKQTVASNFVRDVYQLNTAGFRPDGRVNSLNATAVNILIDGTRGSTNDSQQIDLNYRLDAFGMKHSLTASAEILRTVSTSVGYPTDFNKAPSRTDVNGNPLVGIDVYRFYDPFTHPQPVIYPLISGGLGAVLKVIGKSEQYSINYRGEALDGRLNVMLGISRFALKPNTNQVLLQKHDDSPTYGAIYTITPGLRVFASASETTIFANANKVQGPGAVTFGTGGPLNNEKGKGYEFGFKTDWKDSTLSGTLSYYSDERAGIVAADAVANLTHPNNLDTDPNNDLRFFVNGGLQRARGIDADIIYTPNRHWQVVFNYNHTLEAKVVSDPGLNPAIKDRLYVKAFQRPLAKSPTDSFNVVTKYTFGDGVLKNLSVGGAVRYSSTYSVTNSTTADLWVPAETIIDAFGSYKFTAFNLPMNTQLNLSNITNEYNDMTVGDGFEARLSVGVRF